MTDKFDIDIIGLIRFSHPSPIGFKVDAGSERAQEAFLYDETRLKRRFDIFKTITLPSLHNQDFKNYRIIIMIGENFPTWAQNKLQSLIKDLPATIITQPYLFSGRASNRCFKAEFRDNADGYITFALDDDDALSCEWIGKLNDFGQKSLELSSDFGPIGIYPSHGYFAQNIDENQPLIQHIVREKPYWLGSAILTKNIPEQTIYQIAHQQLPDYMPVFADKTAVHFLRLVHKDSDTAKNLKRQLDKLNLAPNPLENIVEDIETRFGIDPDKLDALFG